MEAAGFVYAGLARAIWLRCGVDRPHSLGSGCDCGPLSCDSGENITASSSGAANGVRSARRTMLPERRGPGALDRQGPLLRAFQCALQIARPPVLVRCGVTKLSNRHGTDPYAWWCGEGLCWPPYPDQRARAGATCTPWPSMSSSREGSGPLACEVLAVFARVDRRLAQQGLVLRRKVIPHGLADREHQRIGDMAPQREVLLRPLGGGVDRERVPGRRRRRWRARLRVSSSRVRAEGLVEQRRADDA